MPGSEETIRIFDIPANEADAAKMLAIVKQIDEATKGISGISIFGKTGNATEARAQQQQMAAGMEQIAQLQAKMIELENQLQTAKAKGAGSTKSKTDEELRAQIELSEAQRQRVASIKDQVKYNQAETDSIVRKRIELKQLQAVYDKLSQTKGDVSALENAKNQVKALSDELLDLEGKSGRFGRNVGNYANSITPALKVLEEEFKKVTAAMSNMEAKGANVQNFGARAVVQGFGANQHQNSGPTALAGGGGLQVSVLNEDAQAYAKLSQQAGYLNTIIQKNEVGFSSVTQQIRTNEKALQSLRAAGMETTEGFEMLREETVEAARGMKEFQRQQKLLESEAPALKALTLAAKGLAGAYAIGAGATALFADGNEKVEKEMNKMIAVMTILQGLHEAWELEQQKGAALTALNTAATAADTFATELFAAATGAATASMTALDAAMIMSGIGALIVALGGLIYLLSRATESTKEYLEEQGKLNDQLKEYYDAIVKVNEALDQELEKQDQAAKKQAEVYAVNVRSIADQEKLAGMKRANAEADKKRADDVMASLKKEIGSNEELQGDYDARLDGIKALQQANKEINEQQEFSRLHGGEKDPRLEAELESNQSVIDLYRKQADALKVKLDRVKEVTNQQEEAAQALKLLAAERDKFEHEIDERQIKALTEVNNLKRERMADYLALQTVAPGGETPQLKALAAEKALREQIINSGMKQELRAEGLTSNEIQHIHADADDKLDKLHVQFIGREAQIRYAASLEEVNQENMTQEALLKLREQFYARQEAQATTAAANRKAYEETQRDESLRALDADHVKKLPSGNKSRDEDEARKYADAKEKIETDANIKIFTADLDLAKKQMALAQSKENEIKAKSPIGDDAKNKQVKDIADLEQQKNGLIAKSANLTLQIEAAKDKNIEDVNERALAKKKEQLAMEHEAVEVSVNTTMAFVDAAAEREINRIDRQIKKNNELKEAETSRIQNSTLEETQKAANMERLQMATDMRNQALQRKLNQTKAKEAEADRDAAVLKIFGNTLIDASEAGWITPAAIAIEVIGAAQIAALLAKTIPKYEIGTDYHPGGMMMVHPGEMRVDPSGQISMTPDQATYTYGEAGTKIIPKHKTDEMNAMLLAGIFADSTPIRDNRLQDKIDALNVTNQQMSRDIVAAIKKQKPAETHVHVDAGFLTYIKSCQ